MNGKIEANAGPSSDAEMSKMIQVVIFISFMTSSWRV